MSRARVELAATDRAAAVTLITAMEARSRRVETGADGCRVVWRQFGAGPPLVLLHGGHGGWLHWCRNIDALAARHALWLPDMPCYLDSDRLPADLPRQQCFPALVARLAAHWRSLGVDGPFDLGGFSFGGLVAADWAAREPSVRRLLLFGTSGHGTRRRPVAPLMSWKAVTDGAQRSAALAHNLRAHMLHAAASADALADEIHERCCLRTRFRSTEVSRSDLLRGLLSGQHRPTLFVWGEHDVTAEPRAVAELLIDGRPEREAQIVPDAGHWVQYERAGAVDALVLRWLQQRH